MRKTPVKKDRGFTLIEIMVSISIFSLVMVVSMGSILSVLDANRKAQTLRNMMDNLNFAVEGMTRTIRFGETYHCGAGGDLSRAADCSSGLDSMSVKNADGFLVTYSLSSGRIVKSVNYGPASSITSAGVSIDSLTFRVYGSYPYTDPLGGQTDSIQPEVIVVITGYATLGANPLNKTRFALQTTISQRTLDFQ